MLWQRYLQPADLSSAVRLLADHGDGARFIAGGTDVLVELSRGVRPAHTLIDISRLHDLRYVRMEAGELRLGALATHNDVIASGDCARYALPLAQACREVGAPQIRARATVAGNLMTASPANDTITPLVALDVQVVLAGPTGERVVPIRDFYQGVRRTVARPDELLREIRVPVSAGRRGIFLKLGLRRAQAIAVVNVAVVLTLDGLSIADACIALGCVAPTIVRAASAEAHLRGKPLEATLCAEAGRLAAVDVAPIDDVRGSAAYRRAAVAALVTDALERLAVGGEAADWIDDQVLLDTGQRTPTRSDHFQGIVETTINGRPYALPDAWRKTLLNALRQDAGLTGTKEGCAEGECGACTVWLDGQAVMSCLVPAAQAHGATVTTIEGLAGAGALHPLQESFIAHGAVQCGYCIPGMIMAGAKLLEERAAPDREAILAALSGNLCRCTGYRKILAAVTAAGAAS